MSSLFGGSQTMPTPQPVPVNPMNDAAAAQARQDAANAALADAKARGRASTVAAGGTMADEAQYQRGLLKQKARTTAASTQMLG